MLVLLECENTLIGIFVTVIVIVFDHASAGNQGFAEMSFAPHILSKVSRSFCDRQTDNDSLDQNNVQFDKRKPYDGAFLVLAFVSAFQKSLSRRQRHKAGVYGNSFADASPIIRTK
jgi:hypothetical protein